MLLASECCLAHIDCPHLRFHVLCIDFVSVTNCVYDYEYDLRLRDNIRETL